MLTLDRIACRRGDRLLFADLSLAVAAGGAAVVQGPNGAGKSSLLRLCAGLLAPAAGRIDRPERVALDAERAALDEERPLGDALTFWARLDHGGAATAAAAAVAAALDALDLAVLAPVPVRLLSAGQRRRAGLARAAASGAALWLLDEPANGLDAASLARLAALVARHRAAGGAVVAATHVPLGWPDAGGVAL